MTKKNKSTLDENEVKQASGQPEAAGVEPEAVETPGDEVAEAPVDTAANDAAGASLGEQLEAAREESRLNHERYLRAVADWENYRRRMTREKEELRQIAVSGLVEQFLPVLDNLDIGLKSAANHPEAAKVTEGFQMVADQIVGILEQNGVKTVAPEGEAFDPHHHEALSHHPHDEVPEGHVVQVVRKGYLLNGRLLRPASVTVSSGAGSGEEG